jgi:hypothetical protein
MQRQNSEKEQNFWNENRKEKRVRKTSIISIFSWKKKL